MKVIIIEGTDNVGKDTVINELKNYAEQSIVFHCDKPISETNEEQAIEQEENFAKLLGKTLYGYKYVSNREKNFCPNGGEYFLIHNRSWYGEYVYGCMYRNNSEEMVMLMLKYLEETINDVIPAEDICFITLLSDNAEFLVNNDDGLSISNANKTKIIEETKRFEDIYKISNIHNKHIIYVNNGDKFRSKEDIFNEILNCIYNKK